MKNKEDNDTSKDEHRSEISLSTDRKKKRDKEFTIDEDFFHSVIMPGIYSTIVAGIRQEYVSLFNLIFSLEIALKKSTITD
jgi:hypothetical protein